MIRHLSRIVMTIAILLASIPCAFAETQSISWAAVTTYTDGTPIEAGKTVNYSVYWTTDPGLGSLRTVGTSIATTSKTFDPTVLGMSSGGTVYFTAKAVLNTGDASALSPAYAWVVPPDPTAPTDPAVPTDPAAPAEPPVPTDPAAPAELAAPAAPTDGRIIKK